MNKVERGIELILEDLHKIKLQQKQQSNRLSALETSTYARRFTMRRPVARGKIPAFPMSLREIGLSPPVEGSE